MKNVEPLHIALPPWRTGTDRQRGRAIWLYLKKKGKAGPHLKRQGRKLVNARSKWLADLMALKPLPGDACSRLTNYHSAREINASMNTVECLAAAGNFVAAGAVYFVFMSRFTADIKREEAKRQRQKAVETFRLKKRIKGLQKEVLVFRAIAKSKRPMTGHQIARQLKIPASTVGGYLAKWRRKK